jgi:hypothetical protein
MFLRFLYLNGIPLMLLNLLYLKCLHWHMGK